jgi:serine/threonine protein kinase
MSFSPYYFGRYILVDLLSKNRNAEIYRAKLEGSERSAPARIVTLKKVLADLSGEDSLAKTFEQEIRIAVGLAHPNIVQTYDFGTIDGRYFMVGEYFPGQNLEQVSRRLGEQDLMFSPELSCFIVGQICQALTYAHNFRDRLSGQPRPIYHRDIAPDKIVLSYEGAVKLVDFGMAKMESPDHFTRVGMIEGSPGYMSPERLFGDDLDGRADVYSLGVMLWEMLTGRPLRAATNNLEEIRRHLSTPVPKPSSVNSSVPVRLDSIVLKATALKPGDRHASADELQRELHHFLYAYNPSFNPQDLAIYVQEFFSAEISAEEEALKRYMKLKVEAPVEEQKEKTLAGVQYDDIPKTGFTIRTRASTNLFMTAEAYKAGELEKLFVKHAAAARAAAEPVEEGKPLAMEFDDGSLLAAKADDKWVHDVKPTYASQQVLRTSFNTSVAPVMPAPQEPEAAKQPFHYKPYLLPAGLLAGFLVAAFAFLFATATGSNLRRGEFSTKAPPTVIAATSARVPASMGAPVEASPLTQDLLPGRGLILLDGDAIGFELEVNGKFTTVLNNQVEVPVGVKINLRARKAGKEDFLADGVVTASDSPWRVTLHFSEPQAKGYLNISTLPEAKFRLDDGTRVVLEGRTPLENTPVRAGTYRLHLENSFIGSSEEMIQVEDGKVTQINRSLARP